MTCALAHAYTHEEKERYLGGLLNDFLRIIMLICAGRSLVPRALLCVARGSFAFEIGARSVFIALRGQFRDKIIISARALARE